jgi:rhamnosyltransferase subunit A
MELQSLVVEVPGGRKVYVEHHRFDPSFETVILINGALATTTSFSQTVKYLKEHFNVVLFDLPYAGQSKEHNPVVEGEHLTKDDEVDILCHLMDRFRPDYLISISWGGVAALLALARGRSSVKRAVIGSFSPVLNAPMLDYINRAQSLLERSDRHGAAELLNSTVGKYLPRLLKLYNYRYLSGLPVEDCGQVAFHISQILALDSANYVEKLSSIRIPLLFVNGELDEYTSAQDVRALSHYIPHSEFVTVNKAGHFLDLEGKHSWGEVRRITNGFLRGEREERGTRTAPALLSGNALESELAAG